MKVRLSVNIKVAIGTCCMLAFVLGLLWGIYHFLVRPDFVALERANLARYFSEQVRIFDRMSRERMQLARELARFAAIIDSTTVHGPAGVVQGSPAEAGAAEPIKRYLTEAIGDAGVISDLGVVGVGILLEPSPSDGDDRGRGYEVTLTSDGAAFFNSNFTAVNPAPAFDTTLTGSSGRLDGIATAQRGAPGSFRDTTWYREAFETNGELPQRVIRGSVLRNELAEEDVVTVGSLRDAAEPPFSTDTFLIRQRIVDGGNRTIGVATVAWSISPLFSEISALRPTSTAQAFLIDPGTLKFLAVGGREDLIDRDVGSVAWGTYVLRQNDSETASELPLAAGTRWVQKTTLDCGLIFGLVVPEVEALGATAQMERITTLAGVLAAVLALMLAYPITSYLTRPTGTSLRRGSSAEPDAVRILLIDENSVTLEMVSHSLQSLGYSVVAAGDAATAVSRIASIRFDLIFVDEALSNEGQSAHVLLSGAHGKAPIVALVTGTNGSAPENWEVGFLPQRGVDAVLLKPYSTESIVSLVNRLAPRG